MWRRLAIAAILMGPLWPLNTIAASQPSPLFRPYIQKTGVCYSICSKERCGDRGGYLFRVVGVVGTRGAGGAYRAWGTIQKGNQEASAVLDENELAPGKENKFMGGYVDSEIPDKIIITVGIKSRIVILEKGVLREAVIYFFSDRIEIGSFRACGEEI